MTTFPRVTEACRRIDGRSTKYRFDLERDIAWQRLAETGIYFTDQLLEDCGVDVLALHEAPAATDLFQWAFALSTCKVFADLERSILRTTRRTPELMGTRSVQLLIEEEEKHLHLFTRYALHLEAQHPTLLERFEKLYARCRYVVSVGERVTLPDDAREIAERFAPTPYPDGPAAHYLLCLDTLLVEEFTTYVHCRLAQEAAAIQPAWHSAHRAHWREEIQHLVTAERVLESVDLSPEEQRAYASFHLAFAMKKLRFWTGIDTAFELVGELFPRLAPLDTNYGRPLLSSTFMNVVKAHPAFARTRAVPGVLDALTSEA
jgi:hypothetical protein